MNQSYQRVITDAVLERFEINPIVALLGPRQCGKTTLARAIAKLFPESILLDLERQLDLELLAEPELFLERHANRLIVIDEIQLRPDLFGMLRSHVDRMNRACKILILGSASRELIRQGAESLAGRVSFLELTPFMLSEVPEKSVLFHWERGGFPRALLAANERAARLWRDDYLRAIVERDLPLLGLRESPQQLRRLLSMLGHYHGDIVNYAKIGASLAIANRTLPSYIAFLEGTFLVRTLAPYSVNNKKRLVKSPKVYFRDSGIFQSVLGIATFDALMASPFWGNAWEGFVLEQLSSALGDSWTPYFYRTQAGAEIDIVFERGSQKIAIECKASSAPKVTRGLWSALDDLEIPEDKAWIVCPIEEQIPYREGATIGGIRQCIAWAKGS